MANRSDVYYQFANRKFIENEYGKSLWVQISGHKELNGADALFWCVLVKKNKVKRVFKNSDWDVHMEEGGSGFNGNKYCNNLLRDGFES
ncbi:hypothetical protein J6Z19_09865, partial [bacterium]|nr:hypothetical protein [bacterium]